MSVVCGDAAHTAAKWVRSRLQLAVECSTETAGSHVLSVDSRENLLF